MGKIQSLFKNGLHREQKHADAKVQRAILKCDTRTCYLFAKLFGL